MVGDIIVLIVVVAVALGICFYVSFSTGNMRKRKNLDVKEPAKEPVAAAPVYKAPAPVVEEKKEEPAPIEEEEPEEEEEEPEEEATEPAPVEEEPEEEKATEPAPVEEPKEEAKEEEKATEPAPVEEKKKEKKPAAKKAPAKKPAEKKAETAPVEEKVAPVVAPVQPKKKAEPKAPAAKADGKWIVESKGENEFMSKLIANNGEVMLSSEIYSTEEGARNGIATIVKNIESGNFIIYRDKSDKFYYKLKNGTNRLLCVGEIYKTKEQCAKAVESVKRMSGKAAIVAKLVEGEPYVAYVPEKVESYDFTTRTRGKWVVEVNEDGKFTAKLFASNGQLMLATEEVAQRTTALKAIDAVKKNSAEGNFIIDKDKFGRFYYKLRNAQKSVICIGEAYEKLDSCTSALESVRRFAATAVLVDEEPKAPKSK